MWGALSMTRRRVCDLQLLLALASSVILGSESRGARDYILLSQIRDFPFRRPLRLPGLRWRYSAPPPRGIIMSSRLFHIIYSLGLTVGRSLVSTVPLPWRTDLFRGYLIQSLRSSKCFLATIATIVLEVRCLYSARWSYWLASAWFNVGGSHTDKMNLNLVQGA
jgi:hypothetical protein